MKNESLTDAEWGIPSRYHIIKSSMSAPSQGTVQCERRRQGATPIHTVPYGIKTYQNVRALWILWQRNAMAMLWLTFYGKFLWRVFSNKKWGWEWKMPHLWRDLRPEIVISNRMKFRMLIPRPANAGRRWPPQLQARHTSTSGQDQDQHAPAPSTGTQHRHQHRHQHPPPPPPPPPQQQQHDDTGQVSWPSCLTPKKSCWDSSTCKQASAAALANCFRRSSTSSAFRWRSWSNSLMLESVHVWIRSGITGETAHKKEPCIPLMSAHISIYIS